MASETRFQRMYLPWLYRFGNLLGGTANAGRVGRLSRTVRTLSVLLSTVAALVAAGMMGFSAFWLSGAAFPLWAMIIIGLGVVVNFVALPFGFVANHLKIEQRYRYRIELHAELNDLRGNPQKLPPATPFKHLVDGFRRAHDLNGVGGTGLSWVSAGWWGLALIGATAALNPLLASAFVVAGRGSALVSALLAWGTNQARFAESNQGIKAQINEYYSLKSSHKNHRAIQTTLEEIFTELKVNNQDKYSTWVRFHAYKAMDKALGTEGKISGELKETLKNALQPFLLSAKKFDREKLRNLADPPVCVLESLPFLEASLYHTLTAASANSQEAALVVEDFAANLKAKDQCTGKMLRFYLMHQLSQHPGDKASLLTSAKDSGLFKAESDTLELDLDCVEESNKVQTPHGSQLPRTHYTEQVARAVVLRSLGARA